MVPGLLAIELLRCTEKKLTEFFAVLERILLHFGTPSGTPSGIPLSGGSTEGYVVQLSEGRVGLPEAHQSSYRYSYSRP